MIDPTYVLLSLGGLLLLGLAMDGLGRFTRLPRVTLLVAFGFVIGPGCLDWLPLDEKKWFAVVADMALVMVGFLLGERFTRKNLRQHGKQVVAISIAVVFVTLFIVAWGLTYLGVPLEVSLLLAGIATATDPVATKDVVTEARAEGPFSRVLLGIVAIDDGWGLIAFSLVLAAVSGLSGQVQTWTLIGHGFWEVSGAVLVGFVLAVPVALLSGRLEPGQPTLLEALGVVLLCGGIALWLNVSFLLASMVLGAVVANLARHHTRPFHAIEGIEWPFMILFFVFAGASLQVASLGNIAVIGLGYVGLRVFGRLLGAWIGNRLSLGAPQQGRWMGLALLPQAGVALGMALVAAKRFPELADTLMSVAISATIFFELIGPIFTRLALSHTGEVQRASQMPLALNHLNHRRDRHQRTTLHPPAQH
jgi:Kef-type K+ transport system membrane component KefB